MTIALRLDLAPELQAIVATFSPASENVGRIGVKVTAFATAPLPFRDAKREPTTNGALRLAEPTGDGRWFEAQGTQRDHLFVALHAFGLPRHLELLAVHGNRRSPLVWGSSLGLFFYAFGRRRSALPISQLRASSDLGPPTCERQLHGFGQILDQVKAIGHLDGLGSGLTCRCRIVIATVAADDLHLGMTRQPGGSRWRSPIWQEIDDAMAVEIDKQRAILAAASKSEIIDPQVRDLDWHGNGMRHNAPQQGRGRNNDPQMWGQP